MTVTTAYAEIVKAERNADGDLVVVGKATGPDLDLDHQICDPAWLAKAMPEWMSSGGNVREQHSSIAAGVATELAKSGDSWMVTSTIVDPVSAAKVEKKVLKGYSIGISRPQVVKDAAAQGGRIVGGNIVEVSLVDRPCNPTCTLTLAKAAKPGMSIAAGDLDTEHMLVKAEEWRDRRGEPAAALAQLAIVKADGETADIGTAQQAIAIIARLIQSEADGLAAGEMNEACDIDLLLQAIDALRWFQQRESQEEADMATTIDMAAQAATTTAADAEKAAPEGAPVAPAATETPAPDDAEKAVEGEQKNDLTELVKALTTQVTELQTQVTKAMSAPAPGGPVLTRTTEDTAKAAGREQLLTKAADYERTAHAVTDPQARQGYLQLAAEARAAATTS